MSLFLLAILAIGAAPDAAASAGAVNPAAESSRSPGQSVAQPRPKTGAELRDAVRDALRRWARPSSQEAVPAGRELLGLYSELRRDTQLPPAVRAQLRLKLRRRLIDLSAQIKTRLAQQKREKAGNSPASVQLPEGRAANLAQQGAGQGMAGQGLAPGGQAPADDAGQDLVDLIQTVIAPATWETAGGNGSIYYWRPGRALVIRQTDEVHEQIGGALDQLRRAGP